MIKPDFIQHGTVTGRIVLNEDGIWTHEVPCEGCGKLWLPPSYPRDVCWDCEEEGW